MPISGLSLQKDATGSVITAGTPMALSSDGVEVKNGVHVADFSEPDFIVRTNMTLKTRNPQLSDGVYTKAKRYVTIVVPKRLADLSIAFNLVRIEVEAHPETTAAELTNLHMLGSQVFSDSDLAEFLKNGSLA